MSKNAQQPAKKKSWLPWIFVGMFGVVITVNGALAYFATSTFNGLQTEKPFEKGVSYNQALAGAAAQEKLGWVVRADLAAAAAADGRHGGALSVEVRDRDGQPLDGVDVFAVFSRPTRSGLDSRLPLTAKGDGSFVGEVNLPLPGQWEMQVVANRGADSFQINQRLMVP